MSAPREALLAVTTSGKGGNRLVAVNLHAQNAGLRPGMLLTDATAIAPELRASRQNTNDEEAHLKRLTLWCRRYAPWTGSEPPDGIRLDVTGCAHLFGGETEMLRDLRRRFAKAGFTCRAAIASTPSAAWGMARFRTETAFHHRARRRTGASWAAVGAGATHRRASRGLTRCAWPQNDRRARRSATGAIALPFRRPSRHAPRPGLRARTRSARLFAVRDDLRGAR